MKMPAFQALVLFSWLALAPAMAAECRQAASESPAPGQAPAVGPESSHGIAALDCLKYVGSIQMSGVEHVLIRDDEGTIHHLKVGDPMGENGGVISRIDKDAITITQRVRRGGKWREIAVRFPKKTD